MARVGGPSRGFLRHFVMANPFQNGVGEGGKEALIGRGSALCLAFFATRFRHHGATHAHR